MKARYKNQWIEGTVVATQQIDNTQTWTIRYQDGYTHRCKRKQLEKMLVHVVREKVGRQLDYILVSTRWKTCVMNCRSRWGPAMHRDLHGERNDHALVECTWRWRIRQITRTPSKDFACLYRESTDEEGRTIPNEKLQQFERAIEVKLEELDFDADVDDVTTI